MTFCLEVSLFSNINIPLKTHVTSLEHFSFVKQIPSLSPNACFLVRRTGGYILTSTLCGSGKQTCCKWNMWFLPIPGRRSSISPRRGLWLHPYRGSSLWLCLRVRGFERLTGYWETYKIYKPQTIIPFIPNCKESAPLPPTPASPSQLRGVPAPGRTWAAVLGSDSIRLDWD